MKSLWIETTKDKINLKTMTNNEETEVCIVGAGIFGLTTAYYLTKQGYKVIVIEKDDIGEKVSGNTTGKITSQHGIFYNHLIKDYGDTYARKYLEANENAIENIKKIVETENIECELEEKSSYIYTSKIDEIIDLQEEMEALRKIGKKAEFVDNIDLPIDVKGAIKFTNQAQFHSRKFMIGLCQKILDKNKIYNHTKMINLEKYKDKYKIHTNNGDIISKYVVIATHYPTINIPGFYFTKMYQSTSYIIAIETNKTLPEGMYISYSKPSYTFRTAYYKNKKILLIGGNDHRTGEPIENNKYYDELENKSKEMYPDSKVLFKWNTSDCISIDKMPYIGEFSSMMPNVYVGTGFKKWGITLSNVAANIIVDKIQNKKNEFAEIFDSKRTNIIKNRWEVKNMIKETVNTMILDKFKVEVGEFKDIKNDSGAIINIDGKNIGIYKDVNGKIYTVNPNCTHLGCLLKWNNLDKTWDCPCHGSRFDYMGRNIYEPAIKNLENIEI